MPSTPAVEMTANNVAPNNLRADHNVVTTVAERFIRQAALRAPRRIYDLRHTFATFALRAGVSTFDLSWSARSD